MKTKLLVLLLQAGSSLFAGTHVFVGVGVGGYGYGHYAPPPPPPVVAYAPPCPGPGYTWVAGYWYPVGPRYYRHAGYWTRPPYAGAYWAAPRHHRGRYYGGSWRR
ncbi:MAG: hypothetical protein HY236_17690 [Acidobacteria bacterium]|nr:hypothetical protein [Acidobacteriota bacterium]